jgi:hypothetical protein
MASSSSSAAGATALTRDELEAKLFALRAAEAVQLREEVAGEA